MTNAIMSKCGADNCRRYISQFVENQFPEYYRQYGQEMIEFVTAYYEFEEEASDQFLNVSSCMEEKNDIDTTLDDFVVFFKSKYMKDLPFSNDLDHRFLVKHIWDLYQSKGSIRSLKLLMQIMYGNETEVYLPGDDVLRPSHSLWWQPRVIEISHNEHNKNMIGRYIVGQSSGAKAFVESVVTKRINGRIFDVVYLTDVKGSFLTNEYIRDNREGSVFNFPNITGSLTTIEIIDGQYGYSVGDLFDVEGSDYGDMGIAKVTSVFGKETKISWDLVDPGFGYSATAYANGVPIPNSSTQIYISDSSLAISNSGLLDGDIIEQRKEQLVLTGVTNVNVGDVVQAQSGLLENAHVLSVSGDVIIVEFVDSFAAASAVVINGTTYPIVSVTDVSTLSTVMESDESSVWSYDTQNGPFEFNNSFTNYVYDTSGNRYEFTRVYEGSGASFEIIPLGDQEQITYFTNVIGDNNIDGVPYLTLTLDSADYRFPKPSANFLVSNLTTVIEEALDSVTEIIGSPTELARINPGDNYNNDVKVKVVNDITSSFDYHDMFMYTDTPLAFAVGQTLVQGGAKLKVLEVTDEYVKVRPITFMQQAKINTQTFFESDTTKSFIPYAFIRDLDSKPMGENLVITGTVKAFDGVVNTVEVMVSGFGYKDGEIVTLYPQDGGEKLTGIARLGTAGKTGGTWLSTTSHLNWSTYIHDNDYYQEYSYEILAPQSLNQYQDVVEDVVHPAGTKMFGKVSKVVVYEDTHDFTGQVEIL